MASPRMGMTLTILDSTYDTLMVSTDGRRSGRETSVVRLGGREELDHGMWQNIRVLRAASNRGKTGEDRHTYILSHRVTLTTGTPVVMHSGVYAFSLSRVSRANGLSMGGCGMLDAASNRSGSGR